LTRSRRKSVGIAYLWWFVFGLFGGHYFYLGRTSRAVVWLCTLGICGLGWLADLYTLPRQVHDTNARTAAQHRGSDALADRATVDHFLA
jgi:RND superfamily putative drug exporter